MPVNMGQFYSGSDTHTENDFYPRSRPPAGTPTNEKSCRACTDFKSWLKNQSNEVKKQDVECPLNKSQLGNYTWSFLHTMAAYFPDKPSTDNQRDMTQFLRLFSRFYPCPTCARDFSRLLDKKPPETASRKDLSHWLCWAHNEVNKKLGKPKFDCSKVDERWKTGWNDGSCN